MFNLKLLAACTVCCGVSLAQDAEPVLSSSLLPNTDHQAAVILPFAEPSDIQPAESPEILKLEPIELQLSYTTSPAPAAAPDDQAGADPVQPVSVATTINEVAPPFSSVFGDSAAYLGCGEACGECCDAGCGEACPAAGHFRSRLPDFSWFAPSSQRSVCDDSCSRITFYQGGVYLHRSRSDRQVLFFDPASPSQNINAGDFHFGVESGLETGIRGHRVFGCMDLDVRYLTTDSWTDSERQRFTGRSVRTNFTPNVAASGPRVVTARYATDLESFEANLRYRVGNRCNWLTIIAGFRYLNINESLNGTLVASGGQSLSDTARVDVDNHLFGLQIGADQSFLSNCLYSVEGFWRAGIYGNNAGTSAHYVPGTSPPFRQAVAGSHGQTSFVGELGIKARYRILDNLKFYGQYQLLFVDGIDVASEQWTSTSLITGVGQTSDSSAFFHGATFGLELSY